MVINMKKLLLAAVCLILISSNVMARDIAFVALCPPAPGYETLAIVGSSLLVVAGVCTVTNNDKDMSKVVSGLTTAGVGCFYVWYTIATW